MREHQFRSFSDSIKITSKKFSQIIFAFSILAAFGYGLYFIAAIIWRSLVQVNPTLAVGVVAAVSTIAVSITSLIVSKYFERKSEIRNEHRQRKTPIYEELIAFIFKILKSVKTNEPMPTEKEMVDFMFDFNQKLIIWGSDEVVTAFSKYRTSVSDPDSIMFAVENLLLAIRKDLGHNNNNLSNGRLLSIFVDNADIILNQIKMKKKSKQPASVGLPEQPGNH